MRKAFTLVEVLVVIAIMGTLMALLLPAIQGARESARRTSCSNNLRQIGFGLMQYHDANHHFPAAVLMPYADADAPDVTGNSAFPFGPNWAVFILPYLEQKAVFEKANPRSYPGTDDLEDFASYDLSWRKIRGVRVATFLCPSDTEANVLFSDPDSHPKETEWARGNYACNGGTAGANRHINGDEALDFEPYIGLNKRPVMAVNYGCGDKNILDGTSKTFLAHEIRIGESPLDRRGTWALGYPGASIVCAGKDSDPTPNTNTDAADEIEGCSKFWFAGIGVRRGLGCNNTAGAWGLSGQARSRHLGGVNAFFADGHLKFIPDTISQRTWVELQSINDGQNPAGDY